MTDPIGTAQERELIEDIARAILIARSWQTAVVGDWDEIEDAERDKYRAIAGAVLETPALQSRIAEVGELRQIIAALGYCTPDASLEFMRLIPAEVEAKCAALSLQRRPT